MKKDSHLSRREMFAVSAGALVGSTMLASLSRADQTPESKPSARVSYKKGDTFNETEFFEDPVTSKPTRRLTTRRDFNQTPTYHLNAAFSADSRYLVLASWDKEGDSYLLKADMENGNLTVLSVLPKESGERYDGNQTAIIQANNWVAANTGKALRLCHLETLEERALMDLSGTEFSFGHPIGSIDGKKVFVPRHDKAVVIGETTDVSVTHLEVDLATGKFVELFHDKGRACNHVVPNPVNPDLLLIDRDLPPLYAHGGDGGKTTRVWVLNRKTKELFEVRPKCAHRFQMHSNWSWKGDYVYYHGRRIDESQTVENPEKSPRYMGHYMGISDCRGNVLWERNFTEYAYGHMCSHAAKNAIITDGLFSKTCIHAIHYEERDASGAPKLELIAKHDSDWSKGQQSHPHCHVSRNGKWLSYNRGHSDRSDVYVVQIA